LAGTWVGDRTREKNWRESSSEEKRCKGGILVVREDERIATEITEEHREHGELRGKDAVVD